MLGICSRSCRSRTKTRSFHNDQASDGAPSFSQVQSVHYCRGTARASAEGLPVPVCLCHKQRRAWRQPLLRTVLRGHLGPGVAPPSLWSHHTTVLWGHQWRSRLVGGEASVPWRPTFKQRIVYKAGHTRWARCPEMAPVSCHLYPYIPSRWTLHRALAHTVSLPRVGDVKE